MPKLNSDLCHQDVLLCAVTKGRSLKEISKLLEENSNISIIAENRWPDCKETFEHFNQTDYPELKRHFIGPLQSNKVRKVLPLVDCIQSVDSMDLLKRMERVSAELHKELEFYFQVNISEDPQKSGIPTEKLVEYVEEYIALKSLGALDNLTLTGLMTIGAQTEMKDRSAYFKKLRSLFDEINEKYFPNAPLKNLSMGMSEDYKEAVKCGSTMLRIGRALF